MIQVWEKCLTFANGLQTKLNEKDEKDNPDDTNAGVWHDKHDGTKAS